MKLTLLLVIACIANTFAQLSPQALDSLQQVRYIKAKYVLHADQNISIAPSRLYTLKGEKYYGEYVTKYTTEAALLSFTTQVQKVISFTNATAPMAKTCLLKPICTNSISK